MSNEIYTLKRGVEVVKKKELKSVNVSWSFRNFSQCLRDNEVICTEVLKVHNNCDCPEYYHPKTIRLELRKKNITNIDLFILFMPPVPVDIAGSYLVARNFSRRLFKYKDIGKAGWQYLATITTDLNQYVIQNITLSFKINHDLLPDLVKQYQISKTACEVALCDDMERLLNDGTLSDVTLLTNDGVSFNVHKSILANKSDMFKAMFHHEHNKTINCAYTKEVLSQILCYIYMGRVPDVIELELFVAADYYQLLKLRTVCLAALHRRLTPDNAMEILEVAYRHATADLLETTLHYIKNGHADLITKTDGWKSIQSATLLKRLFEIVNERDKLSLPGNDPTIQVIHPVPNHQNGPETTPSPRN